MGSNAIELNSVIYKLLRLFGQCYSPRLFIQMIKNWLPAKTCSTLISFVAKIKLYDLQTLKKQDSLIAKLKFKHQFLVKPSTFDTANNTTQKFTKQKKVVADPLALKNAKQIIANKQPQLFLDKTNSQNYFKPKNQTFFSQKLTFQSPKVSTIQAVRQRRSLKLLSNYKELCEFVKIISCRLLDLEQFLGILNQENIELQPLKTYKQIIKTQILKANQMICKIVSKSHSIIIQQAKQKHIINFYNASGFGGFSKLKKRQAQRSITKKNTFLERQSSNSFKISQKIQGQNKNLLKLSKFKQISKSRRTTLPEKLIGLVNDFRDDPIAKNTQQMYFDDLEQEHEQQILNKTKNSNNFSKLEKQTGSKLLPQASQIIEFHCLINSQMKNVQIQKQNEVESKFHSKKSVEYRLRSSKLSNGSGRRPSIQKYFDHRDTINQQKVQVLIQSKASSASSFSSKTTEKVNIYSLNARKKLEMDQKFDKTFESNKNKIKRNKFSFNQIKKKLFGFDDNDQSSILARKHYQNDRHNDQFKGTSRRNLTALPLELHKSFQRIVQAKTSSKIFWVNNQKEKAEQKPKKYKFSSKSIGRGCSQTSLADLSSNELGQNSFKRKFGINAKPAANQTQLKDNCFFNYSELLTLQKSMSPIATYNEDKMINRYTWRKGESGSGLFQLKRKNETLEFHLRSNFDSRTKTSEKSLQREKEVKKENNQIDFMNQLQKSLERWGQPLQTGFQDYKKDNF